MNLTISFNPEYISNQLKFKSDKIIGSNRIASLIRLLKKKQIILLIDKGRLIVEKLLNELKLLEKNIDQNDFNTIEIFLSSLRNNSNNNEFECEIKYLENFENFCLELINDQYPIDFVIDDNNKYLEKLNFVDIENISLIDERLEMSQKQFYLSDNKEFKENEPDIIGFKKYKDVLFKTFWCSDDIKILAKEFFVNYMRTSKDDKNYFINRDLYHEGLDFIIDPLLKTEKFTKKKLNLTIITGLSNTEINKTFSKNNDQSFVKVTNDFAIQLQAKSIISTINQRYKDSINFNLIVIYWEKGDENTPGIGHGRKIYSEYGGFITEYMPFEIFQNKFNPKLKIREKFKKNSSFLWFNPTSQPNWSSIGAEIFNSKKTN
ncbi:hypothetical protein OAS00_00160 [Candidatus Pelagibacter sp.]|nr:hypothetical protein [Candidatus Pelagibacter sp.]